MSIKNITKIEIQGCIIDELNVKEEVDNIDYSPIKELWDKTNYLLARFQDDLEAGNIKNGGLKISKFIIKRRSIDDTDEINLGVINYDFNKTLTFIDNTQPNDYLIYSIVPLGEDGITGVPNSVEIESDFTGWWITHIDDLNKEMTQYTEGFDVFIDSIPDVQRTLNQGRIELQTMSRYPTVFYNDVDYMSFSLEKVIYIDPCENTYMRSGKLYRKFLDNIIRRHTGFIAKGSNGEIYIVDVHNPRASTPTNTWKGYDYDKIQVDCVEVQDYKEYMKTNIK